nr:hypothetical transcript [Hymenolepis microstoma]
MQLQLHCEVNISKCPTTWSHPKSAGVPEPLIIHLYMPNELEANFSREEPKYLPKDSKTHYLVKRYIAHRNRDKLGLFLRTSKHSSVAICCSAYAGVVKLHLHQWVDL